MEVLRLINVIIIIIIIIIIVIVIVVVVINITSSSSSSLLLLLLLFIYLFIYLFYFFAPRYFIPSGFQILSIIWNKKSGKALFVCLLVGEGAPKCHCIKALYCQRDALEQESAFSWVPRDDA